MYVSCISRVMFTTEPPGKPQSIFSQLKATTTTIIEPQIRVLKWNKRSGKKNNNPVYETAKETLMYKTVLWILWERERVGRIGRMALKHVKYHV